MGRQKEEMNVAVSGLILLLCYVVSTPRTSAPSAMTRSGPKQVTASYRFRGGAPDPLRGACGAPTMPKRMASHGRISAPERWAPITMSGPRRWRSQASRRRPAPCGANDEGARRRSFGRERPPQRLGATRAPNKTSAATRGTGRNRARQIRIEQHQQAKAAGDQHEG